VKKWNLVVDIALCHNCNNCVLATKDELIGNAFPGYTAPHALRGEGVLRMERSVRGTSHHTQVAHRPVLCNHCDDAPCVRAGGGAIRKRDDGIVVIDPVAARGRRDLIDSCPYGAMVWNEAEQVPQTWFFDAHLLDQGWSEPRCVGACPTGALTSVQLEDSAMAERVREEGLRTLKPELGTRPRVHYRHLERFDRLFVAGSVLERKAGVLDCVEGATVELRGASGEARTLASDAFGDFRFDDLPLRTGVLQLQVRHPSGARIERSVLLADQCLTVEDLIFE
jgi:Fe-S-cluster-containing dehydrogenase component